MLRRPIQRRHWIAVFYLLMSLSTFDSYLMHSRVARSLGTFQHSLLPKNMNYNTALVFPDTAKMFRNIPCIACTSLRKSPSVFERSSISVTDLNIQRGQWLQISCHLRVRQNLHHDHQSHHYRWLMTAATTLAHGKTQGSWSRRWTLSFRGSHHHHHNHRHRHCHHHGCIHPHHHLFLICAPPPPHPLPRSTPTPVWDNRPAFCLLPIRLSHKVTKLGLGYYWEDILSDYSLHC